MKYLKYVVLTIILLGSFACHSTKKTQTKEVQEKAITYDHLGKLSDNQQIVKKELDAYLKELSSFNTDAIVDMTYPRLFSVIDLDLFRQYIASMMNSTDIEMTSYESNVTKISKVTTFSNETQFAQIDYTSTINIRFLNHKLYDNTEKINFLYDVFIHKYGKENITIDIKERTLQIKKAEKLLVIKEKDSKWKFLGDNSKYRQLYPAFLPLEILKIVDKNTTIITPTIIKKEETNSSRTIQEIKENNSSNTDSNETNTTSQPNLPESNKPSSQTPTDDK